MKRHLIFAGDEYYANGGAWDFVDDVETIEEAESLAISKVEEAGRWSHIFDLESGTIAACFERRTKWDANNVRTTKLVRRDGA